jgi:hypothetical protein
MKEDFISIIVNNNNYKVFERQDIKLVMRGNPERYLYILNSDRIGIILIGFEDA